VEGVSHFRGIAPVRRGFTLLELLLASVAAAMLLSALYFSFDMTISQTQAARDIAGTEDLTRAVFNRFAIDIGAVVAPQPAQSGGTAGMQVPYQLATTTSGTTSTGGSSTGAGMSGSSKSSNSSTNSSSSSSSTNTALLGSNLFIPPQSGVIGGYNGNLNMLILFTSRVPDIFTTTGGNSLAQMYGSQGSSNNDLQIPADLRRVVYWLGSNGGLYRQETPWVMGLTSYNLSDLPYQDSDGVLIADEVKGVTFEFYDPLEQTWGQSYWDGTGGTSPPYSLLPGPPPAIRITLTFEFANPKGGAPIRSTYIQTFPILSAAGQVTQTLYNPTANGATSSSGGNSNVVGAKTVGAQTTGAKTVGANGK
jgi:prepilin-type N-terminal cleavage/methylation domain-containing protein